MIFNTWSFALFAAVALAVYWACVPQRYKPLYLIAAGAVFYAFAVPAYLALIVALGGVTYAALRALTNPTVTPRARTGIFAAAVAAMVAVLGYFKYSRLLAITVDAVAGAHVLPIPQIVVPLAISFFTFEFVHVLADAHARKLTAIDALDFAAFALFSPRSLQARSSATSPSHPSCAESNRRRAAKRCYTPTGSASAS